MNKLPYLTPIIRIREAAFEDRFLDSLDNPGGSDMPIDELDPNLWG